jgi:hypothetical protein
LWAEGLVDAGILTQDDLTLLRYWHEAWEFLLMDGAMEDPPVQRMSDHYVARWSEDGKDMVARWNEKQPHVEFIYDGDYWK